MQPKITHLKNKLVALIALSFAAVIALSNAAGTITAGHGGRTGAPFDTSSCTGCHTANGTAYGGAMMTVQLLSGSSPVTTYIPGASYTLLIKVNDLSITTTGYYYGYQTVCVQAATNNNIDGWGIIPASSDSLYYNSRTYVGQSATIHALGVTGVSIPWTAPASGTGSVRFYSAGCLVNHNFLPTNDTGLTNVLTITESAGCVAPTLDATPTAVTCYGYTNGSINLTATGGTGAIGYSWTGPGGYVSSSESVSGLAAGIYTVVVTATGGCTDTTTATVTQPPALTATVTANAPLCPGTTLTFTTTATGGSGGAGSYSYTWSGPNSFSSGIEDPSITGFSVLDSGTYTFTVTDVLSCSYTTTIDIGLLPIPVVTLGPDTVICPGGSITLGETISGQTYLWNTTATSPTVTVTDSGYYSVTATLTSSGCAISDTVHVGFAPVPVISLGPDTTICDSGGSIVLGETLTGDTYIWSTTATSSTITVTDSGYYSVTVTNSSGCSASDTVYIGYSICDSATSVINVAGGGAISLYPNPANEFITINTPGNHVLQNISVYDELGNKVYDHHFVSGTMQQQIGISRFPSGIYSVRIETDAEIVIQKLVITR